MKKNYFSTKRRRPRTRRRGIYILPNFFTTCSLFCGFYSIISCFNGDFSKAAWAIVLSGVFDWLDGRIARISNTMTRFGLEYDSLTDFVAFGVAPGVMIYTWVLMPYGRVGWLAAFLYVACAALRLARFNLDSGRVGLKYFEGMPTPGAGGMIAATVLLGTHLEWDPVSLHIPVLALTFYLAFMMVSKIHFGSLKLVKLSGKSSFYSLVAALCVIVIVAAEPQISLFFIGVVYSMSGPIMRLKRSVMQAKKGDLVKEKEDLV